VSIGQGGGYSRPPLENAAAAALAAAKGRMSAGPRFPLDPPRPPLTEEQRTEAMEVIAGGAACRCCSGIHPGDEMACPRLASFELDGDGNVRAGTYFAAGSWDRSGIVFATDVTEEEAGDGAH
jgi:hypothetical protein